MSDLRIVRHFETSVCHWRGRLIGKYANPEDGSPVQAHFYQGVRRGAACYEPIGHFADAVEAERAIVAHHLQLAGAK